MNSLYKYCVKVGEINLNLNLNNWNEISCILEVDLEYPTDLHDLHNDYPLAPETIKVNKVDKLIPNLNDKTKYILHYVNLKQYESLGLKITKIHIIIIIIGLKINILKFRCVQVYPEV